MPRKKLRTSFSKNYTFRLSPQQFKHFQAISEQQNIKMSSLIRYLIFSNPVYTLYYKQHVELKESSK